MDSGDTLAKSGRALMPWSPQRVVRPLAPVGPLASAQALTGGW